MSLQTRIFVDASVKGFNGKSRNRKCKVAFLILDSNNEVVYWESRLITPPSKEDSTKAEADALLFLLNNDKAQQHLVDSEISIDCQSLYDMVHNPNHRKAYMYPIEQIRTKLQRFNCNLSWIPRELNRADEYTA